MTPIKVNPIYKTYTSQLTPTNGLLLIPDITDEKDGLITTIKNPFSTSNLSNSIISGVIIKIVDGAVPDYLSELTLHTRIITNKRKIMSVNENGTQSLFTVDPRDVEAILDLDIIYEL